MEDKQSNQPSAISTETPEAPAPTPPPAPVPAPVSQPAPSISPPPSPAAPSGQNLEGVTINTTSVLSKAGLYTRVTFIALWVLVLAACSFISSLIVGGGGSEMIVFYISIAIIAAPIFFISNGKRTRELQSNPTLIDDVFVKKYLRSSLFLSIFATSISAFYFVFMLLSKIFVESASDSGKGIAAALVYSLGFGAILAFCWQLHSKTKK